MISRKVSEFLRRISEVGNLMRSTRKELEWRLAPVHEVLKMPHMPREHEHLPAHCTNEIYFYH